MIFARVAAKEEIPAEAVPSAQAEYFQKGRACLRASPLPKQYGWGVHHDDEGKIALVAMDSEEYAALVAEDSIKKIKAMRRSRG